jgi:hypothetical protein
MNKPQHNETGGDKPKYFEKIRAAIIKKQGLSFVFGNRGSNLYS